MNSSDKTIPTIDHKPHAAFFRQSGWLMIATIIAGVMSYAVHLLSKHVSESEYGSFVTMLMVTACIPVMPIQMLFTQQTSAALATNRLKQLSSVIRLGWLWTFILWAAAMGVIFIFQNQIATRWQLDGVSVIWVTMGVVLMNLWMPLFSGVLQGRQDFFWLGWLAIVSGFGRLAVAAFFVLAFHAGATGMIAGGLVGIGAWAAFAMWRTRDLWTAKAEKIDGLALLKEIAPILLGFTSCLFLFMTDTMFVKAFHFSDNEMASYGAAGTLSRGLLWVTQPLSLVMFPKLVHATAKSQKSNLMTVVLIGTGILAVVGSIGLCVVGPIVIKAVYTPEYVAATMKLLPWYAGAMVPLALGNVLVNDLMARAKFKIVPFLVILAVAYGFTLPFMLRKFPGHMEIALQTFGAFNFLLFLISAGFSFWGSKSKA